MKVLPWLLRRSIKIGQLKLISPDGLEQVFGGVRPGPSATLRINDSSIDRRFLFDPELSLAEGYMSGDIEIAEGSLRDVIEVIQINRQNMATTTPYALRMWLAWLARRLHQNNSLINARRNVEAHYDIGNDLYRLFLDEDMQYSCAYFSEGTETLEAAQQAKKRHIAAKLQLEPGQRVLDIGCGWGGLGLYLAQVEDVEVTGVTLAREQLDVAQARAKAAGLSDRVKFELRDYRDVQGKFDRIVSVGMLEHVGAYNLGEYFANIRQRLAPDGVALIHSIFTTSKPTVTGSFVRKYIFPGGYTPTLSETHASIEEAGLWPLDTEILRLHYAYTLSHWAKRFAANRDMARALYDERFCRMWELYLNGAEMSFRRGALAVMQLQLGLDRLAAPITRDYLSGEEARLALLEPQMQKV